MSAITSYHAHVYYDAAEREKARRLCEAARAAFGVTVGRMHDGPVGPHPRGSCQLSVATDIDLPGRVPSPVETACYFSIAELLTNAAKHSGGREARIAISHEAGVLRTEVTDFGLGGADPARGTGLTGIERRLAAFDGLLAISSPVGGPTIVVMEVPCALSSPKISSC